jgi:hypothetical protein
VIELVDEDPETLAALLDERGWGDGLPIVAPTPARVDAMLEANGGDADAVLGVVPPRDGLATVQTVAVNAVMAGCTPDVLPVVTTAVQALTQPEVNLRGVQATTHPVAPLVVVHGAIAERLGFNAGTGCLGPGTRANATVGRAVRFVLMHVGGARPGDGDAATQGAPSKYTYCTAEHTGASPWPPFPTTRGVDAPSAVTVFCGEGPHNVHDMESDDAERIMEKLASAMTTLGSNNACISQGELFVMLCPEHAATIAANGWSRDDVQQHLFDHARLPRGVLRHALTNVAWAPWMLEVEDDDALLPMTEEAANIRVLVVGGAGKHSSIAPSWGMTRSVTLPIWDDV